MIATFNQGFSLVFLLRFSNSISNIIHFHGFNDHQDGGNSLIYISGPDGPSQFQIHTYSCLLDSSISIPRMPQHCLKWTRHLLCKNSSSSCILYNNKCHHHKSSDKSQNQESILTLLSALSTVTETNSSLQYLSCSSSKVVVFLVEWYMGTKIKYGTSQLPAHQVMAIWLNSSQLSVNTSVGYKWNHK